MYLKILAYLLFSFGLILGQTYSDQFYSYEKENLISKIESFNGTVISNDGKSILLEDGIYSGSVTFLADSSAEPFNRGLPSWNGHVSSNKSAFRVLMRFYKNGWSPWLTVGYWKENIWSSYGTTNFSDGKIDYDYVVLNSFYSKWQFKVEMRMTSKTVPSPSLHKLSFYISDQRTTDNVNITSIVNDNPPQLFINTEHFYQYALDPGIGGDICSPTSVSMVLKSYGVEVDPLQFARDNYDPYWGIFGMWPRAVQNAAEYDLNGAVTRYRSWSEAYDVLAEGGRVVMSVGPPLYTGHLMMLAGFDENGIPLVHDPAKSSGYSYKYNKTSLSQSWFNKGGIAYTFYQEDSANVVSIEKYENTVLADNFSLSLYPNPFNPQTIINFQLQEKNYTEITIYDIIGREVSKIYEDLLEPGNHNFQWNASNLPSGMYLVRVSSGNYNKTLKAFLIK